MIYHLFSSSILNGVYDLLNYLLYLNNHWFLDYSFNNFFNYSLYLFDFLFNFFYDKRNLSNDLNFFDLNSWNIYSLLNCYQFLYFYNFLYNHFNFYNFWHFDSFFDYFFYDSWDLYYFFIYFFNLNNLFHDSVNIFDNLDRYMDHLLYLLDLNAIYDLLDYSINRHNNRYLYYPLNYLFNKMRNLNSSLCDLECSKNFIGFLITNLAMAHLNHSFINF